MTRALRRRKLGTDLEVPMMANTPQNRRPVAAVTEIAQQRRWTPTQLAIG